MEVSMDRLECILLMMVYPVTASVFLHCFVVFTEKACKCREVLLMEVSMDSLECILPVMLYPVTVSLSFGLYCRFFNRDGV